jgi:pyrroloquinoline quinone biosynthesis protein B
MKYSVDYAFIDGNFYDSAEIDNRDISEIPHPYIIESLSIFKDLPSEERRKIYFIHFNHINPPLNSSSIQRKNVQQKGFNIAGIYDEFQL